MLEKNIRSIFIGLSMGLAITACQGTAADYSNEYNALTDFPYMFHMQGDGILVAPTEKGYYFLNGHYLYYADKSEMKPVLLDNRPENGCRLHSDQEIRNCHAYIKHDSTFRPHFLGYYNNKLYALESGKVWAKDYEDMVKTMLIELAEDGSARKVRMEFDTIPRSAAIHRGLLYYTERTFNKGSNASAQLMQVRLEGGDPETIYAGSAPGSTIQDIVPYGNNIYFYENVGQVVRLMRYDIKNRTVSRMFTEDDGSIALLSGIYQDRLLYVVHPPFTYEMLRDEKYLRVYSSDLEGGVGEELPIDRTFFSFYYTSGKYFYARPVFPYLFAGELKEKLKDVRHELTVYDDQFRIVDQIDLSFLPLDHSFIIGDDRYMFIQVFKDGKIGLLYLDKQNIGTGKAAFKPLLENIYGQ